MFGYLEAKVNSSSCAYDDYFWLLRSQQRCGVICLLRRFCCVYFYSSAEHRSESLMIGTSPGRFGMRWSRTHDKAMVMFIFCSCCMSLNVLFAKIRRMVEIRELERTSEREAQIASIIYYNSTLAGSVSLTYRNSLARLQQ